MNKTKRPRRLPIYVKTIEARLKELAEKYGMDYNSHEFTWLRIQVSTKLINN